MKNERKKKWLSEISTRLTSSSEGLRDERDVSEAVSQWWFLTVPQASTAQRICVKTFSFSGREDKGLSRCEVTLRFQRSFSKLCEGLPQGSLDRSERLDRFRHSADRFAPRSLTYVVHARQVQPWLPTGSQRDLLNFRGHVFQ